LFDERLTEYPDDDCVTYDHCATDDFIVDDDNRATNHDNDRTTNHDNDRATNHDDNCGARRGTTKRWRVLCELLRGSRRWCHAAVSGAAGLRAEARPRR
jgi:hypothetical protein